MFGLNPVELMIIGVVAVLLFGARLPNVARSLGKSMMEFKKGLHEFQDDVHKAGSGAPKVRRYHDIDDRDEATAPKFEPPTGEPKAQDKPDAGDEATAPKFEPPAGEPKAQEKPDAGSQPQGLSQSDAA